MKPKDIEAIQIAGHKLRAAIRSESATPTVFPADEDALCDAVDAIIDAVINELDIRLFRSDPPAKQTRRKTDEKR